MPPRSYPALFEHVPGGDSGIFLGAITAIMLDLLLNREPPPNTAEAPVASVELH